MTPEDLKSFLEENKVEIAATVKRATIEKLMQQHSWDISSQIREVVSKFVADEVIPEVEKELQTNRGMIVEAVTKSVSSIADDLAKAMTKQAAEQIGGYNIRDIVKAIFGVRY